MSRTQERRHRRGRNDDTPDTNGADTVTLQSREFIEKLRREYVDNTRQAKTTKTEADRAFQDAARFDQQATDLTAKEQAAYARLQQAQTDLQQIQQQLQEIGNFTIRAREHGTSQMANSEKFEQAAEDARTVMAQFGIDIPDLPEGNPQDGIDPAGPTRLDPVTEDPLTAPAIPFAGRPDQEIADSVDRLIHHHETDPAGEAGAA